MCSSDLKAVCAPIFGSYAGATMTEAEKAKYYPGCESDGNFGFYKAAEEALVIGSGQGARKFIPVTGQLVKVHQYDIESVVFSVTVADKEDPDRGQAFYVYPNQYADGVAQSHIKFNAKDNNIGTAAAGNYMGKRNLPGFFAAYGSKGSSNWNFGLARSGSDNNFRYPDEDSEDDNNVKGDLFASGHAKGLQLKESGTWRPDRKSVV